MAHPLTRRPFLAVVAVIVLAVVIAIAAGVPALPTVVLGAVVLGFAAAWTFGIDREVTDTAPPRRRVLPPDEEVPLGATPEAHEEISPHDLPPGHPGRTAAEAEAGASAARGGEALTTGDVEERPETVRDDGLREDRGGQDRDEGRFTRGDVEWTATEQGRGRVRGPRSSQ